MGETRAACRLKIKRYRVLMGKLGAKNQARGRLQALVDEIEEQLRNDKDKDWSRKFEDPIPLPNGKALNTLRDAADYITSLPKKRNRIGS